MPDRPSERYDPTAVTVAVDEDDAVDTEYMLDWFFHKRARTAERVYPPGEQAEAEVEAARAEGDFEFSDADIASMKQKYRMQIVETIEIFSSFQNYGYEPVHRAERYLEYMRKHEDQNYDDISWDWLMDTNVDVPDTYID